MYERTDKRYAGILLVFALAAIGALLSLIILIQPQRPGFLVELSQAPEQSLPTLLQQRVISIRHAQSGANVAKAEEKNKAELIDAQLTEIGWQ